MFRFNFMWLVVASLWLLQPNEMFGQECVVLYPEVRAMGFTDRDLGSEE